ncbi:hypothetical protein C8Q76DRAFT_566434, partial [Earliella scabrosa]
MYKAATKYGLRVEMANPSEVLKLRMPSWYHVGQQPGRYVANSAAAKCLRDRHEVSTIADCVMVATRLRRIGNGTHRRVHDCECYDCDRDRRVKGCDNPNRCAEAAKKIVVRLNPIWKPEGERATDGLSHDSEEKRRNVEARRAGDHITFDPSITGGSTILEAFRIFVPQEEEPRSAPARRRPVPFELDEEALTVYTDGSACNIEGSGQCAGSGIWCGNNNELTMSVRVPNCWPQTNQVAELYAITTIAAKAPPFAPMHIMSD